MENDKRRNKRLPIDVTIKLKQVKQGNEQYASTMPKEEFEVELVNVSKDGIAFKAKENLMLNTYFDAHLVLWAKEDFECVIEIVRMENTGQDKTLYGCRFIGITNNDQLLIQIHELIEANKEK